MSMAAPTRYVVSSPDCEGESAETAISSPAPSSPNAKQNRIPQLMRLTLRGFPAEGTERQVAWALKIRAELLRRNPDDPRLKRKTAKF